MATLPPAKVGLGQALAAPVGPLPFAGEVTAWQDHLGIVHGARTTAEVAARQVLAALG